MSRAWPDGGGALAVDGNTFTIRGKDGASVPGLLLAPAGVKLAAEAGRLTATRSGEFFVVMTVQKGEAPRIEASGARLDARAKVGRRQVLFDGKGIRIDD